MKKYILDSAPAKRLSAYAILKGTMHVATVRALHSDSTTRVEVLNVGEGFSRGTATGYGYDRFTTALAGLSIHGHLMTDHAEEA